MANNVNSNLTQRLFAYMQHKVDLTPEIAELYKNSLIFLGDQKQIYVPLYNAYVGIGMDAYYEVTDRVDSIEQSVADLKEKSSTKTVSSLQVQRNHYHPDGMQGTDFDGTEVNSYAKPLNGDILITGLGDYNEETGFSWTNNWQYSEEDGWTTVGTAQNKVAYSGIRISYYTNSVPDEVDGQVVMKPIGHQLIIDDHLTWSYMLGAYTYTLDFSRDFTNSRIETLYHDLLGVGETVYAPIAYSDLFKEDPSNPGHDIYVEGDYWYKNGDTWTKLSGEPVSGTQYYTQSTTYNNSYNMNIADGIQTLKEVAYILDQITDGALGGVTYVTKSEWDAANGPASGTITEVPNAIVNGKEMTVNSYVAGGVTYWRVISSNDKPTTNSKQYGYYITEANPDNIGIQIAYSIAGNNTAIVDLHEHIDYIEQGVTTLRSTSYVNDAEGLISLSQWSTKPGFVSTDTEESLPDASYKVGDVRSFVYLDLANTYLTYNHYVDKTASSISVNTSDIPTGVDSDVTRINIFEKVNFMNDLPQYSPNTYYKLENSTMTKLADNNYADWPTDRSQVENFNDKNIIYWIPADASGNEYGNNKFKQLTTAELLVEAESNPYTNFYYKGSNDQYVQCTEKPIDTSTSYYYSADTNTPYVQHAVIDTANHIATTAWVKGYFDDSQGEINDKIDNILDKAKQYTNEKIDGLDNNTNYSYAYFNSWMTTRGYAFTETPGTSNSITEHNSYFEQFVTESDATANQFNGSYVKNRLRSQYISQLVETDGIVEIAETTELPTDMLEINNDKWSAQSANKGFTEITLPESTLYGDNPADDYAEKLLTFVYGDNTDNKAIYVKGTGTTYVKLKPGNGSEADGYIGDMTSGLYIMNSDGTFSEASAANRSAFKANNSSIYNQQIYKTEDTYYEVDLESIKYKSGGGVEIAYVDNSGDLQYVDITSTTKFYKRNEEADKVQYLTGKVTHYSYEDAGVGQNKITLNVNITNIEDAEATNTGFADAYDVKTYIENIFSWVDLSANVSAAALTANSNFYKELKLDVKVGTDDNAANTKITQMINNITSDGTKICYKSGDNYTVLENPTGSIVKLGYDSGGDVVAENDPTKVAGTDFYTLGSGTTPYDLYTTQQSEKINPINMSISKLVDTNP